MNAFGMLFLAAVACAAAIKLWLGARHLAHVGTNRAAVPAEFTAQVSLESHQRAADYTRAKTTLGLVSLAVEVAVLLALTFGGGLQWLRDAAASAFPAGIPRGLALIVLVGLVMTLIELPISLYSTFRVEARFGFNKMTPALFWKDFFKGLLLAAALGLPLAAVVLWLMEKSGSFWWLYAWLVWMGFNILLLAIYPTWIAPLFNKFTPMENAALKERIEQLLNRCGFKVKGIGGDGRFTAQQSRQCLFHRLWKNQTYCVFRHADRAPHVRPKSKQCWRMNSAISNAAMSSSASRGPLPPVSFSCGCSAI